MMVAGFIARQNGSPVNGETPYLNSNVPNFHSNNNHNSTNNTSRCSSTDQAQYCNQESSNGEPLSPGPSSPMSDSMGSSYEVGNHMQRKDLFSQRKQREFIPDNKKDESYWDRRRRNNEAAKRSREKRRFNDMILEQRVVELSKENHVLKAQLSAIKEKFGIIGESVVCVEQVMASLPTNEQVLSITKRSKLSNPSPTPYSPNASPIPTSVIHQPVSSNGNLSTSPPALLYSPSQVSQESNGYSEPDTYPPYSFAPVLPPLHPPVFEAASNSVLNLSRTRSGPPSPYELSGSSSDENCTPISLTTTSSNNNSLPHKLRHKSHLGDKDMSVLSLPSIKQEPCSRGSPPWDGEGSSDERDSGISLGVEWNVRGKNKSKVNEKSPPSPRSVDNAKDSPDHIHLKSEVARLASEVDNLKSILSRK